MTQTMGETGYTAVDTSVCRHLDEIVPEAIAIGGMRVEARVLRRLDDGTVRSAVITLPAGWRGGVDEANALQIYVLDGALDVEGQRIGPRGFAVLRYKVGIMAPEATQAIVIRDPPSAHAPEMTPVVIADALDLPPFTPTIAGRRLDGFERRVLWENPVNGADTRLLRVPAGFRGGGPNWHPVHEEIFCIEGDIEPDATRPMRGGSFLWNPARSVHGFGEHTVGGCVLLEWHDGAWALHSEPGVERS